MKASSFYTLFLILVSLIHSELLFLEDISSKKASIIYDSSQNRYFIKDGIDESAVAYATYIEEMEKTGWDKLALSSYIGEDSKYPDEVKAYGMGYLEGQLTFKRISDHYENCKHNFWNKDNFKMPDKVKNFLTKNFEWMNKMVNDNKENPFWKHVFLLIKQWEGLIDGYNAILPEEHKLTIEEALIMNAHDIGDLIHYKINKHTPIHDLMPKEEIEEYIDKHNHCSGIIKMKDDFSDAWFGHNTWTNYSSMIRIFKEYRFKTNTKSEKAITIAMSSYPGAINSIDDFYITDQDLYVTETTNNIFNNDLYDLYTPESLLTWIRTVVANRLSDNGKEWTDYFAMYNSGTYNNQMQILDLKKINIKEGRIDDDAFWIIEQIPGFTQSRDMTQILSYGYWPSYNSAYFKNIRQKSGYDDLLRKRPELKDSIDYEISARAKIFRRDHGRVKDIESLKTILRYNNYKNEEFAKGNPYFTLASRADLKKSEPDCRGATDAKLASIKDVKGLKKKKIYIISGPTTSDNLEPFNTKTAKCKNHPASNGKYIFKGMPEEFNFDWIVYETTLFTTGQ